jgi:hypothetical protein
MPKVTFEMPSFGGWVEGEASKTDKFSVGRLGHGSTPWNFKMKSKGSHIVASLYEHSAEIFDPDAYNFIQELAARFEAEFVGDLEKDAIELSCHFLKPKKKY